MICPNEDHKWGCCCRCESQIRLVKCNCGKCPSTISGYVCVQLWDEDGLGRHNAKYMGQGEHGQCEMFVARKVHLTTSEGENNDA